MGNLNGKIALVTGASRGIGLATSRLFAAEGATVVMTARTQSALEAAAAEIPAGGGTVRPVAGDVTDEHFVQSLFDGIRRDFGRIDIVVNNAGVYHGASVAELPVASLRESLELNIVAPFLCTQQAIRLMRETKTAGKIINIGSVRSHWTEHGDAGAYNAAKVGLRAMTESIARELHGDGSNICVGLVCPGIVDTTMTNNSGTPQPDWLQAEQVAQSILHAVTAPPGVNVYDITLFPTVQRPW